jgi:hypothetical protein
MSKGVVNTFGCSLAVREGRVTVVGRIQEGVQKMFSNLLGLDLKGV